MTRLNLFLLYCAVYQRGIQFFMAKELLYLFDRHPSGQQIRGNRPPKSMRVRLFDSGPLAELPKHVLDSGHRQTTIRMMLRTE